MMMMIDEKNGILFIIFSGASVESAIDCHLRKLLLRTIFNLCGRTTNHLSAQTTANDG